MTAAVRWDRLYRHLKWVITEKVRLVKGSRQHGGLFDEERQVGTGQWPSRPEWAVLSVRRNTGFQNRRLAGKELSTGYYTLPHFCCDLFSSNHLLFPMLFWGQQRCSTVFRLSSTFCSFSQLCLCFSSCFFFVFCFFRAEMFISVFIFLLHLNRLLAGARTIHRLSKHNQLILAWHRCISTRAATNNYIQKLVKNAHHYFPKPKLTYSNILFCASNCPKHKDIKFTLIDYQNCNFVAQLID